MIPRHEQLEMRRSTVLELSVKGKTQRYIADVLKISCSTVNEDLKFLRKQSKDNLQRILDETLPDEFNRCLVGLRLILNEAWIAVENSKDVKEKVMSLTLVKDIYQTRLDLLTNTTTISEAVRFISSMKNSNGKGMDNSTVVLSPPNRIKEKNQSNSALPDNMVFS